MNHRTRKKYMGGFSLLEVLVAFSIIAVSLVIVFQIYARGARAAILGQEYAQAVVIAESRLAEIGTSHDVDVAQSNGRLDEKYDWQVSVGDYLDDPDTGIPAKIVLRQVEVLVTWNSAGKPRTVRLVTLKPAPPA